MTREDALAWLDYLAADYGDDPNNPIAGPISKHKLRQIVDVLRGEVKKLYGGDEGRKLT